jgi:hypothetical protein
VTVRSPGPLLEDASAGEISGNDVGWTSATGGTEEDDAASDAADVDGAEEEEGGRSASGGKGFTLFWSDMKMPSRIIVSKPSCEFFTCSSICKDPSIVRRQRPST